MQSLWKVKELNRIKKSETEASFNGTQQAKREQGDYTSVMPMKARELLLKGRALNRELLMKSRLGKSKKRLIDSRALTSGLDMIEV